MQSDIPPPASRPKSPAVFQQTFKAKRGYQLWLGLFMLAISASVLPAWQEVQAWLHGGGLYDPRSLFALVGGPLFFWGGLVFIANSMMRFPRLHVGAEGIKYETIARERWARWPSLSAFELKITPIGNRNRVVKQAIASITGPDVSPNLQKKKQLRLPNLFIEDLENIVEELNQARGDIQPAITRDLQTFAAPDTIQIAEPGDARVKRPLVTYGIFLVLTIGYLIEQAFPVTPPVKNLPSVPTLLALGALNRHVLVETHQWYRIFTAALLHGSFTHLVSNGVALFFAGIILEKLVGRLWFTAIFILGAAGGSMMSLALNSANQTSIGASGAVMALFAALFVLSFRMPAGYQRQRTQYESLRILIPSLLPLASAGGMHIDLADHFGGFLTGTIIGYILLKLWPKSSPLAPCRNLAAIVVYGGLMLVFAGIAGVASHYTTQQQAFAQLMSESDLQQGERDPQHTSTDLINRFPHDPRAHMLRATALLIAQDRLTARYELETALKDAENFQYLFGDKFVNNIRAYLAIVWAENGALAEGQKIAAPVCNAADDGKLDEKSMATLAKNRLCD